MSSFDFPQELWLQIISYLPKNVLHRMIGVNRLLFELALNDLYEEVRFISDDNETTKVLDQLKHANISKRTRRLLIRPTFLPTTEVEDLKTPMKNIFQFKLSSYVHNIADKSVLDRFPFKKSHGILARAQKAIRTCTSLEEITIVLHDQALTLQLMAFFDSLWSSPSICKNIRKLAIDTTVAKLPLLLNSLLKRARFLSKLEEFDITISPTRQRQEAADWDAASSALVIFLKAFKHILSSFTFSSFPDRDIGSLFKSLPHLHNLKTFKFFSVFNAAIFPTPEYFTTFISMHAHTLQNLVIKPHARSVALNKSDISYTGWLNSSAVMEYNSLWSFSSLVFPNLRTLDLGLGECWHEFGTGRQYLLPDFPRITPNLTSLILTDTKLSNQSVLSLLDILSQREEGSLVTNLAFSCYVIFPELFDLLYKAVPCLKSLSIQHISYIPTIGNVCRYKGRTEVVFAERLASRMYSEWVLKYVRLASPPGSCGSTHPNVTLMKIFAQALPSGVVLDSHVECECPLTYRDPDHA